MEAATLPSHHLLDHICMVIKGDFISEKELGKLESH